MGANGLSRKAELLKFLNASLLEAATPFSAVEVGTRESSDESRACKSVTHGERTLTMVARRTVNI